MCELISSQTPWPLGHNCSMQFKLKAEIIMYFVTKYFNKTYLMWTPSTYWKPIAVLLLLELFFIKIEFHWIGFIVETEWNSETLSWHGCWKQLERSVKHLKIFARVYWLDGYDLLDEIAYFSSLLESTNKKINAQRRINELIGFRINKTFGRNVETIKLFSFCIRSTIAL